MELSQPNKYSGKDVFNFDVDYYFENEKVSLSPLNESHYEGLLDISVDKEIWTFFTEKGEGKDKFKAYFSNALKHRIQKLEYSFSIFDKGTNRLAGMTRLYNYDEKERVIKMGHTWLGKESWGKQINKNCKFLLFEFLFEDLGLERIGFGVHGHNVRSASALENIGCSLEGRLRNYFESKDSERVDLLLFSLLKNEWQSKVKFMSHNK